MPSPAPDAIAPPAGPSGAFVLELAAEPSLIVTARLFAAGLARLAGCAEEQVENVKLAVSEACAIVLGGGTPSTLRIDAHLTPGRIGFSIGPLRDAAPPVPEDAGGLLHAGSLPRGLDLIALIVDDARVDSTAGGDDSVLRFSIPVDEAEGPV